MSKIKIFLLIAVTVFFGFKTAHAELNIGYAEKNTYLSEEKVAPISFTGINTAWHQEIPEKTTAEIYLRFKHNQTWGNWYLLEVDIDGHNEADYENPNAFLPVNPTDTFQYKVVLSTENNSVTPIVKNIQFTYINSQEKQVAPKESLIAKMAEVASMLVSNSDTVSSTAASFKIISRSQWGADESLRLYKGTNKEPKLVKLEDDFEKKYKDELKIVKKVITDSNGNLLTWPLEYPEKIRKIIIHHTATTKDLQNPKEAIRGIYYTHTVLNGWGDIGYNYLIDQYGNVYEGRAGGDSVVGAHAGKANIGSIGIAILGDYQNSSISEKAMQSLITLINLKTKKYNINPTGSSTFRTEMMPNIIGHKDVMSTACPGAKLYAQLPSIRLAIKDGFTPMIVSRGNFKINQKYDFGVTGDIPFLQFNPGEKKKLRLTLKNNGPEKWGAGTHIVLNKTTETQGYLFIDQSTKSSSLKKELKVSEEAAFEIDVEAAYASGLVMIEISPVINGNEKLAKYLKLPVEISSPIYDYEVKELKVPKQYFKKGETASVNLALKNTGNIAWKKSGLNKFNLGADSPRDHLSQILPVPSARIADLIEKEVKPDEIGNFKIDIKAPAKVGKYREYFTPVMEDLTWFKNKNSYLEIYVYDKKYKAKVDRELKNIYIAPGKEKKIALNIENQGGVTWDETNKVTFTLVNKNNLEVKNLQVESGKLTPGEISKLSFTIKAPTQEGLYTLRIVPKINKKYSLTTPINLKVDVKSIEPQLPPKVESNEKQIRVDLSFNGNPIISADGNFIGENIGNFTKDQKVEVIYENNRYKITSNGKEYFSNSPPRFYSSEGAIMRIDNYENRSAWNTSINNNEYRGILEPHFYQNEMRTINELSIEDYLKGTGEINDQDPIEKIKTIIILARSYATFYVTKAEKFPGAPFHLNDDPAVSQKYVGYSYEKRAPNTVKAVDQSKGLVVKYQGEVIKTPYFSTSDGRTRSAEEVWGWKDTPYLVSVQDPYCNGKTLTGHGVGLSGCGSLEMAKLGKTYEEIIKYYYQGVEIGKIKK